MAHLVHLIGQQDKLVVSAELQDVHLVLVAQHLRFPDKHSRTLNADDPVAIAAQWDTAPALKQCSNSAFPAATCLPASRACAADIRMLTQTALWSKPKQPCQLALYWTVSYSKPARPTCAIGKPEGSLSEHFQYRSSRGTGASIIVSRDVCKKELALTWTMLVPVKWGKEVHCAGDRLLQSLSQQQLWS